MMFDRALSVLAGTVCAVTLTAWPAAAAPVNAPTFEKSFASVRVCSPAPSLP